MISGVQLNKQNSQGDRNSDGMDGDDHMPRKATLDHHGSSNIVDEFNQLPQISQAHRKKD